MSMRPKRSTAASTMARTSSSDRTSTLTASASAPAARTSSATVWIDPGSRSVDASDFAATTTLTPFPASASAMARPMPRLAPVMIAVRPCSDSGIAQPIGAVLELDHTRAHGLRQRHRRADRTQQPGDRVDPVLLVEAKELHALGVQARDPGPEDEAERAGRPQLVGVDRIFEAVAQHAEQRRHRLAADEGQVQNGAVQSGVGGEQLDVGVVVALLHRDLERMLGHDGTPSRSAISRPNSVSAVIGRMNTVRPRTRPSASSSSRSMPSISRSPTLAVKCSATTSSSPTSWTYAKSLRTSLTVASTWTAASRPSKGRNRMGLWKTTSSRRVVLARSTSPASTARRNGWGSGMAGPLRSRSAGSGG